jgi:hypothetical protein
MASESRELGKHEVQTRKSAEVGQTASCSDLSNTYRDVDGTPS